MINEILAKYPIYKAHATQNDFVVIVDPEASISLSVELVADFCNRRYGVGGDGIIRIATTAALLEQKIVDPDITSHNGIRPKWFMDYYNADGSLAEMCGNGARVFAEVLSVLELENMPSEDWYAIGTRGGVRQVQKVRPGVWAVNMGSWSLNGVASCKISGISQVLEGKLVDLPNPHTVCLTDGSSLDAANLQAPIVINPEPENGTNIELVVISSYPSFDQYGKQIRPGLLEMRVKERGVGETMSCGTGCCASAVAATIYVEEMLNSLTCSSVKINYADIESQNLNNMLGSNSNLDYGKRNSEWNYAWVVRIPGGVVRVDLVQIENSNTTVDEYNQKATLDAESTLFSDRKKVPSNLRYSAEAANTVAILTGPAEITYRVAEIGKP